MYVPTYLQSVWMTEAFSGVLSGSVVHEKQLRVGATVSRSVAGEDMHILFRNERSGQRRRRVMIVVEMMTALESEVIQAHDGGHELFPSSMGERGCMGT